MNQAYVLPGTTLLYYNSSLENIPNYDINSDLQVVIQMTFGCNVMNAYDITHKLANIEFKKYENYLKKNKSYFDRHSKHKYINYIIDLVNSFKLNENEHKVIIDHVRNMVDQMIDNFHDITSTSDDPSINMYQLSSKTNKNVMYLKQYLYLIFLKLFAYLNLYKGREDLLKERLVFAVRHDNLVLFNEIKKKYIKDISAYF
jgi:hypothetical protein